MPTAVKPKFEFRRGLKKPENFVAETGDWWAAALARRSQPHVNHAEVFSYSSEEQSCEPLASGVEAGRIRGGAMRPGRGGARDRATAGAAAATTTIWRNSA